MSGTSTGFREQDHSDITTVDQLQEEMRAAGINPYHYVIWDHQRALSSLMGVYQVTPVPGGYRLDSIDRGSVVDEGIFPDQDSLVRRVVATTDPVPPRTLEQRTRAAEAGFRARTEGADERARDVADFDRWLEHQASSGTADRVQDQGTSSSGSEAPPA